MMVFSGLLRSTSPQTPRRPSRPTAQDGTGSNSSDLSSPEHSPFEGASEIRYLRDKEHIAAIESEDPDLRELNNSLVALAAIFPDVQIEVFREMLSSFEEESRLAVVTETLLKHKMKWVRGRYKVAIREDTQGGLDAAHSSQPLAALAAEDKFRSNHYKKAVKSVTYHEFKGLSKSTINAVLAEFNHSYTLARPTLVALSGKSWRFSLSSLFLRRKPISSLEAEHHPLVIWQSTGQGSIIPTLKGTGSPELDKELFETLILPIRLKIVVEREEKDHALALELNNNEAETNEDLHDCECCFTARTFEELSACDNSGHFICFECVRHAVNEAIFGQGWQRNIDLDLGTLKCVAAMSDDCDGCIPQHLVRRAFSEDKAGHEVIRKLDERLAEDSLLKTNLPLVRCPFCSYAEIDELYLPDSQRNWRIKQIGPSSVYTLVILILGVGMIPFLLPVFLLFSFLFLLISSKQTFGDFGVGHFNASVTRLRRKRLGLKFVCQSKLCGRSSCLSCCKAWTDIHICHESSLMALRTQVELAMSLAIKRTCPRCNTSFVKSSGCNKLTCVCGYQMCYVCRKDIGNGEGYRHFCEHFRPNGGRGCTECAKCDLYRCEDDEVVVKKAKEEAERRWMEKEGPDLGGDDKLRRVMEEEWKKCGAWSWDTRAWRWTMPNWEQMFDTLIEGVIE
ncbi:Ubiquitin-conjugating enzyme 7-interacting 1 [Hyphodiscus hymeniophilus]|uniref:Ubiquitin-conjugating enzyme 7-interacting 1 n=1 Tax=Hyphodiscus hymeniophilus TaxID=353542 RepID=A0A9P7AXK3_9HELO|nr:Ubiquitin-conjugating enzyme 7-interacting 1 [Hyphodiscus hymeniophilus]